MHQPLAELLTELLQAELQVFHMAGGPSPALLGFGVLVCQLGHRDRIANLRDQLDVALHRLQQAHSWRPLLQQPQGHVRLVCAAGADIGGGTVHLEPLPQPLGFRLSVL